MTEEHDAEAFREKLRYWRENGAPAFSFNDRHGRGGGRQAFHDSPSKFEQERKIVADAKARGVAIDRYDPNLKDVQLQPKKRKKLGK